MAVELGAGADARFARAAQRQSRRSTDASLGRRAHAGCSSCEGFVEAKAFEAAHGLAFD
jgi:hypothetical protein